MKISITVLIKSYFREKIPCFQSWFHWWEFQYWKTTSSKRRSLTLFGFFLMKNDTTVEVLFNIQYEICFFVWILFSISSITSALMSYLPFRELETLSVGERERERSLHPSFVFFASLYVHFNYNCNVVCISPFIYHKWTSHLVYL